MADLPTDWTSLAALALLLGLKHGVDADHLATIDALTRLQRGRPVARWCGALFSLGHGAVVIGVAAGLALMHQRLALPGWLHASGAAVSIVVLTALGIANLRLLLAQPAGAAPQPAGWIGRWIVARLTGRSPWMSAAVGALFALSFDTLSQAAVFALASPGHGAAPALVLGGLFTVGMLLTDALNGWCISRLLSRADGWARRASRTMGWGVALASLGVAALGFVRLVSPALDDWADARAAWLGAGVVALLAASFALAWRLAAVDRRASGSTISA
ncbi:nickel transporter [Aquabacterium humicola]|uniref:HoxN/HupN/NixA family nickel/cobalt transporter n=1 Tax=Aquabacterium humicola TaxID=3237377 RepID=UPI002542BFD8|nr:nickel transporter [Rubrivivax pictus]